MFNLKKFLFSFKNKNFNHSRNVRKLFTTVYFENLVKSLSYNLDNVMVLLTKTN